MIPKIIHYCWLSGEPIPEVLDKYMSTWKKFLPDYEFILWDKSRFNIHSVKWVEQAYNEKKYAFASDYIRLYALYHYGGIYIDMDMELLKPFDLSIFTYSLNWGLDEGGDIEAAFVASSAEKNPILLELMKKYENMNFINVDGSYNMIVANRIIQDHLIQYGFKKNNPQMQILENINVQLFPVDYFNCRSLLSGELFLSENSYCIHWHTILWASRKTKYINWLRIKILIPLIGKKIYIKYLSKNRSKY